VTSVKVKALYGAVDKGSSSKSVHGVGFMPLAELMEKVVEGNFPAYV
jgi:hypothetical protein